MTTPQEITEAFWASLASERTAAGSGWYAGLALYLHQLGEHTRTLHGALRAA